MRRCGGCSSRNRRARRPSRPDMARAADYAAATPAHAGGAMDASAFFQYPGTPTPAPDAAHTLLRNATAADWRSLVAHTTTRRFVAGEWLIREGESDDALHFLRSGQLEVLMPRGRRGPQRLALV